LSSGQCGWPGAGHPGAVRPKGLSLNRSRPRRASFKQRRCLFLQDLTSRLCGSLGLGGSRPAAASVHESRSGSRTRPQRLEWTPAEAHESGRSIPASGCGPACHPRPFSAGTSPAAMATASESPQPRWQSRRYAEAEAPACSAPKALAAGRSPELGHVSKHLARAFDRPTMGDALPPSRTTSTERLPRTASLTHDETRTSRAPSTRFPFRVKAAPGEDFAENAPGRSPQSGEASLRPAGAWSDRNSRKRYVQVLRCYSDNDRMELAGLEPATSWVRSRQAEGQQTLANLHAWIAGAIGRSCDFRPSWPCVGEGDSPRRATAGQQRRCAERPGRDPRHPGATSRGRARLGAAVCTQS
jgi:hypothetical protein